MKAKRKASEAVRLWGPERDQLARLGKPASIAEREGKRGDEAIPKPEKSGPGAF